MTSSKITNAHIGVFAGKRSGLSHDRMYSGGVLQIANSEFENNYVDIMFSEISFGGICHTTCAIGDKDKWHSSITGNTFLGLSDEPFCEIIEDPSDGTTTNYVDHTLDYYAWYYAQYGTNYPNWVTEPAPQRCHIIDLSMYVDLWEYEGGSTCCYGSLICGKNAWSSGTNGNITSGNTYFDACSSFPPHRHYH